ncbi:hypothetical protein PVAP13_3KG226805 [Panicum virgatum]|uniref:Uncharacterized protein n=1 Tax=Panicum virgatum TaxID=38727 RepID=A0A8T0UXY4_PANVG|nr:hypothetical protein PVAP13_3KG226805 [Panicum virgatum]
MFLPKSNCSSHQLCFYPPATLNSPSTTAGPEQLSIRLLAVAGGTGEKRKATEVLFLAHLDRCRSTHGVDMADCVFPKDFPDFIAEAPDGDGDRPVRVRGLLSFTRFSTITSSAPPMAMDAASRLLDAGFPVYLPVASRLLTEEAAILEADLPACFATSCACSCPRCGAAPSYARSASLICAEAVTRSPTLTSAPSCSITRLCRRACFLRSWKKNREHTREWRERIELLELDIREVKQVAYAR